MIEIRFIFNSEYIWCVFDAIRDIIDCIDIDTVETICNILTPIVIFIIGTIYSERFNKKNLKDNKINRLANFNSTIICDSEGNTIKQEIHIEKILNQYKNDLNILVPSSSKQVILSPTLDIEMAFKSISDIYPTMVYISKATLVADDSTCEYTNIDNNYKPISIYDEKKLKIPIFFCISTKIQEQIILKLDVKIKNQYKIVNDCQISCAFKFENNTWKLTKNFLTINNTYEEE